MKNALYLLIVALVLSLLFWEGATVTPLQELQKAGQELDKQRSLATKRQELRNTLTRDLIDQRISLEDAAKEFRELACAHPSMIGGLCQSAKTDDELEACALALIDCVSNQLRDEPDLQRQAVERLKTDMKRR